MKKIIPNLTNFMSIFNIIIQKDLRKTLVDLLNIIQRKILMFQCLIFLLNQDQEKIYWILLVQEIRKNILNIELKDKNKSEAKVYII